MKCPECGNVMESGCLGVNAYGAIGGLLYAQSPAWYSKRSFWGTGGESLRLSAGLNRIFYLCGFRCRNCRKMLLSY